MANQKETISKDFFTNATKMTLHQFENFLREVVLKTDPSKLAPIILWSAPGCAKSELISQIIGSSEKGLATVILSQVGPLDMNGLAHVVKDAVEGDVTDFTPTRVLGRGRKHLFLDELNNAAPSTLAAAQNLLSAKVAGGDSFKDVHIIAACNPPSTNSLANDLNYPTISRCINIVLNYDLNDYLNYAMMCGTEHPAIVAFHKKTQGRYLQAKWGIYPGCGYEVPEPMANEPFPCPRSWTITSRAINALSGAKVNNVVDYTLLKPLVEGSVGIKAADEFASVYAYMNRIPDIEKIFEGSLDAKHTKLEDTIAVHYLTMTACINNCLAKIAEAANKKITARVDSEKSEAYKLLSGLHYSVRFVGIATSPELGSSTLQAICQALRNSGLSGEFMSKLLNGVDSKKGLTRVDIVQYSSSTCNTEIDIQNSVG